MIHIFHDVTPVQGSSPLVPQLLSGFASEDLFSDCWVIYL